MRIGLAETRRDGNRVVLTLVVVAAVVVGTFVLLEFRPTADGRVDTAQAVRTAAQESSGADGVTVAALKERDQLTVRRLRHAGKNIPWQWRRKLVRRTAPALAKWIGGINERLRTAGTGRVPAAVARRGAFGPYQARPESAVEFLDHTG